MCSPFNAALAYCNRICCPIHGSLPPVCMQESFKTAACTAAFTTRNERGRRVDGAVRCVCMRVWHLRVAYGV